MWRLYRPADSPIINFTSRGHPVSVITGDRGFPLASVVSCSEFLSLFPLNTDVGLFHRPPGSRPWHAQYGVCLEAGERTHKTSRPFEILLALPTTLIYLKDSRIGRSSVGPVWGRGDAYRSSWHPAATACRGSSYPMLALAPGRREVSLGKKLSRNGSQTLGLNITVVLLKNNSDMKKVNKNPNRYQYPCHKFAGMVAHTETAPIRVLAACGC